MCKGWQYVQLGKIADFQNGYAFSSKEYVLRSSLSKEVFRMGYIKRGGGFKEFNKPIFAPLSSKGADTRYTLSYGDIVIAMTDMKDKVAILGNCARIPVSGRFLLNQRVGRIKTKSDKIANQRFLYYFLNSPFHVQLLRSKANSGVQVNLTTASILESIVSLPPIKEQKAIARILGTFDEKIELNKRTNETLEGIAKALFKSWFIDFDPVRAKADSLSTGLTSGISELFPDSFIESELGKIPSGWSVRQMGACSFQIESGKRPKGGIDQELQNGIPSVGAESIAPIGQFDFSKTKYVTNDFAFTSKKGWVKELDVALYKDGGKPGDFKSRVAMYGEGFPFDRFMVNEHVFLLRSREIGQPFIYYLFNTDRLREQINQMGSSKAAQPGLNQQEVKSCLFVKPENSVLTKFNELTISSIKKQLLLGKENLLLVQLRDSILAKLISGELRVPDVEMMLEAIDI